MADTYRDFETLAANERSGIDYQVLVRRARPPFALIALHGGGIEPGTSEIADAIACERFSFYAFEGIKPGGNSVLHITSTKFNEPMCLTVLTHTPIVITIHGEDTEDAAIVFLGGLDENLGGCIRTALIGDGFDVREDPILQGRDELNICKRGTSGAGVQLELSHGLRSTMFESLTRDGRKHPTERFDVFVNTVLNVLKAHER
jgi:phage replication-related protein YjqB (UPF0714/DUF867 family)